MIVAPRTKYITTRLWGNEEGLHPNCVVIIYVHGRIEVIKAARVRTSISKIRWHHQIIQCSVKRVDVRYFYRTNS